MKNPSVKAFRSKGKKNRTAGPHGDLITYNIGDTVLVKTDKLLLQHKLPSIGVILFMWEIRRMGSEEESDSDKMRNEVYYILDGNQTTFPEDLLGHCHVTSMPPARLEIKSAEAWSVSRSRKRDEALFVYDDDTGDEDEAQGFYCHLAIDSMCGLYFNFRWDQHRLMANVSTTEPPKEIDAEWGSGSMVGCGHSKKDAVSARAALSRPKEHQKLETIANLRASPADTDDDLPPSIDGNDSDSSALFSVASDFNNIPQTPSINKWKHSTGSKFSTKRGSTTATPRKQRSKAIVHPTPHSKAILNQRDTEVRLPRPLTSAKREEEFEKVLRCVGELLEEGSGGCVYTSGVLGTGKTATVHAVVIQLKRMAENNETYPLTYVEINGLKILEPPAAYNLLWEGVSGHDVAKHGHLRIGAKESLKALTRYFSGSGGRGPGGHTCVLLMDELDQLVTAKQDVMYNFFNWPTLVGSKLVVIAVANTMDLPERVMSGRVRSRLGWDDSDKFQPYTSSQLQQIIHARLQSVKDGLEDDAQEA
ncbi:hypothetical protein D9615_009106 [Tricholomella constricta]|uniref:Origin recognition complex subunit 1 n=1 Tax=Tricholomella constricta TaxID=117010 RepID=A0A8H5H0G1_9AGAR|nr:hypothetical protein D9615_009106 [Tricholomella constricta]